MNMTQRTIKVKLQTLAQERQILSDTIAQYADCFNQVAQYGWEQHKSNGVELHKATYYVLRQQYPQMPSQLVISARMKATESLKSVFKRLKQKKHATCPQLTRRAIRYDARSYHFWSERHEISIATVAGRLRFNVVIPPYFNQHLDTMLSMDSADLIQHENGGFWLHITITIPDHAPIESDVMVGVDVGISRIAVTSQNQFFDGKHTKEHARKLFRLRRALQSKDTRSARKHLRKLRQRENRFRRDVNHRISKQLASSLPEGSIIAMENLTDIRERVQARRKQRRELHNWPFAQFQEFVTYKAEGRGIKVQFVDARYSSQACSRCGHIARSNRLSQSWFKCHQCGYQSNADRNAALNLAHRGMSAVGGLSVKQPIVALLR